MACLSWAAVLAAGCSSPGDPVPTASPLSNTPSVEVPLSFSDLTVRSEGGVARFQGAQIGGEPGRPALPVKTVRLLLAPDADLRHVTVDIEDASEIDIQGTFQVQPAQPPRASTGAVRWPQGAHIVDGKDMDVYGTDALFPASNVGRVTPGQMHRFKVVEVAVVPYRWNPVTGAMRALVSGRLVVRAATAAGSGAATGAGEADARDVSKLAGMVANFDTGMALYQASTSAPGVEVQHGALGAGMNGYAIITTEQIKSGSYLDRFADAKVAKGFSVEVVTPTDDYLRSGGWVCREGSACGGGWGGGTGDVAAGRLRAWLKANYVSHKLAYVLLIGNPDPDTGDVPMKRVYSLGSSQAPVATDFYYAELSGNWDFDGDGYLGEPDGDVSNGDPDVYSEVIVGRIPFYGSLGELNHILAKTIAYGNVDAGSIAWRRNALLAMKPLDFGYNSYQLGEWIRAAELAPEGWASTRVYDQDFGVSPEVTPCTYDNVLSSWRSTPRGMMIWSSHGWSGGSSEIITWDRAAQLDDVHPSFTFAMSCSTALPAAQDNLTYSLLRNGAIGSIGATDLSWYSGDVVCTSGGEPFAARFADYIVHNRTIGDALSSVRVDQSNDWANIAVFTLYGDPSLAINTFGAGTVAVPPAPATPTIQTGDLSVSLSWNAVPEASAYVVRRASSASGPFYDVTTTSSTVTSYTDRQVVNGATYYYVVIARNAGGDSTASPQVSTTPGSPLKVQYQVGDASATDNVMKPFLRIVNTGTVAQPLASVSVRYYFTDDTSKQWSFSCDSATVGCANVTSYQGYPFATGANLFLGLSFSSAAPALAPGASVEIRGHISHADGSTFSESDDYSYDAARLTFADYRRVPAYVGGVLRWGDEPTMPATIPDAPGYLLAKAGNGRVTITWAATNGATAYKVYRSEGGAPMVRLDTVSGLSYVDTTVTNGVAYHYYVSAVNSGGESWAAGTSDPVTPSTDAPAGPPAAPANLVVNVDPSAFFITWDPVPGATTYNAKIGMTPGGPYVPVSLNYSNCTLVTKPGAGEVYYIVVTANNAAGEGPISEELEANSLGVLPAKITGLVATPGNAQVSLSWNQAARADGYRIYQLGANGGYALAGTTQGATATTFTITGLANGTSYTFMVRAYGMPGEGQMSTQVSATPVAPAEPCSPAQDMTGGQSGNFNTAGSVCKRTADDIVGWGCSNFAGRTVKVNNVLVTCGQTPLPPKLNGYYYFDISAGSYPWASLYWWR